MKNNTYETPIINVGIVDDHPSFTNSFINMLNSKPGMRAVLEAGSGEQLLRLLKTMTDLPDILLMDVEMDDMNGIEATRQVTELYPSIKTIAYSGKDDDWSIIQMINAGACAYLTKKMPVDKTEEAIREVYRKGKYQADLYHPNAAALCKLSKDMQDLSFTENEKRYLQLLCKGYLYAKMADEMRVTVDAVSYYHTCLSRKLNTKSKAVMVLVALRLGIVPLHEKKYKL
jgi:DNA-binding NarL/FixJ family response regulator